MRFLMLQLGGTSAAHRPTGPFGDGDPVVLDGPSGTTGLIVRSFRILEVRSAADAVAWARRCPLDLCLATGERAEIEIHEIVDGPPW